MMGRGAEGGTHQLVGFTSLYGSKVRPQYLGMGTEIYNQALKAVASKTPSRDDLEHPLGGALPLLAAPLSLRVTAPLDSKRKNRAKKAQPRNRDGGGPVSKKRHYVEESSAGGDSTTVGQFWTQMDDYFRDVTCADIPLLLPTTQHLLSSDGTVSDPCLLIPSLGRHYTEKWAEEDERREAEVATQQNVTRVKRKLLGAGPVSKKSKKLSGELVTTVISPPPEHEDEGELCHVCNGGDSDETNQILFCDVCNVAVHQDCYGVHVVPEGQWLCSWCIRKASRKVESSTSECLLCPIKGGALKPVLEVDSKGNIVKKGMKFAHLFCSQWIPETYIGNMEAMEPIRNVEGVREERWRLLCSVCKDKQGACIQCSHGLCATAFHPLCAREAKLYMEVSSREDSEDIDLRAYCSKHSSTRLGKVQLAVSEGSDGGTSQLKVAGDEDAVKKSSVSGAPADVNFTEDSTEKRNEEQESPSGTTYQLQNSIGNEGTGGQALVDSCDADADVMPNVVNSTVEENQGIAAASSKHLIQKLTDIAQGSKVSSPSGEGLDSLQPVNPQDQGMEQGGHVAASPSLQSCEASQSSHPDSTDSMEPKGSKIKVSPRTKEKSEVSSKLSKGSLIVSWHSNNANIEENRGQQEVSVVTVANGSGDVATVWDERGCEERRQRGLSGETSTSHSHATSPSDSPVVAQTSISPSSHKLDEKDVMDPITGSKVTESARTSKAGIEEDLPMMELGNAEKVCRKSVRQPNTAVRADIGKLSIANGTKLGSRPGTHLKESPVKREPQQASPVKPTATNNFESADSTQKVEASLLPVKIEDTEGQGQDQGLHWNKDALKSREVDANGAGSAANESAGKRASASRPVPSTDSEEEVSQTEAINLDLHHTEHVNEPIKDALQAYAHPFIMRRLKELQQNSGVLGDKVTDRIDHVEVEISSATLPHSGASAEMKELLQKQLDEEKDEELKQQWEQLLTGEKEGILELAADDEIQEEILILQDTLLNCAQENRGHCERLLSKLIPRVPEERALSQRQANELAFVHRYVSQAREAKKQGRKERRDKEAQIVLAAATAAAAASPRVGYIKRDSSVFDLDHPAMPLLDSTYGQSPGVLPNSLRHSKPPVPKPIRPLTSANVLPHLARPGAQARTSFLKTSSPKFGSPMTGSHILDAQGDSSVCDICNSGESSRANKIVACDTCKVTVHQECYGLGRIPLGAWLCQPCLELQRTQNWRSLDMDPKTKHWVQCALCTGQGGAIKRSTDGRWVHVFCAQWMPETVVGKDQAAYIEGLENVLPDRFALLCSICQQQGGACLTCNFGHCHGAFHPTCARESGLFMSVRIGAGGRLQYRAYCDRHSSSQRAKDEQAEQKQRSGTEDMHALRQIRVEFERVRLICERICRRERLKRDVLQSTKDIYLAQLMFAGHSGMGDLQQPHFPDPSGMNRGNSFSIPKEVSLATMQAMGNSQHLNQLMDAQLRDEAKEHSKKLRKFKKHGDTKLHREKLMTPIEASMQNKRLPKGYAYVPVDVYVKGTIAPTAQPLEPPQHLPPTAGTSLLPLPLSLPLPPLPPPSSYP